MTSPLRQGLAGIPLNEDRLWTLSLPSGEVYAITEYNHELTGFDPRLQELEPSVFEFGGNAYYILTRYAPDRNWKVQEIEDRR